MQNYKRREVSNARYEEIKKIHRRNNNEYQEHIFGSRRKLYVHNHLSAVKEIKDNLDIGDLSEKKFTAFIALFQRNLYNAFKKNQNLYSLNIEFKGKTRVKNTELWDKTPKGTIFYNIDLSSAYWQFAFRLGYISENIYLKYMDLPEYKEAKIFCVSFLLRKNIMKYVKPDGSERIIVCDNSVLERVYRNILNSMYSEIFNCTSLCFDVLEKNLNGISVLKSDYEKVKTYLKSRGLVFKVKMLIKTSDTEYLSYGKIRKFRK